MAMIENIRKRRGLLIFFIGLGMLGFLIPYDAVMSMFGRTQGSQTIGELNGEAVNAAEWQEELITVEQSRLYTGGDNISSAAWSDLTNKALYGADLDAAGYEVGEEEYDDLRFGVSPSSMVKTAYYGGTVTEESRERARNLFETQPPQAERAQKSLIVKRYKLEKLESLLKKGLYANSLDAERDYQKKNDKASVEFVAVKYASISDSTVTVSDSQVLSYFNKNKMNPKYTQTPFRGVRVLSYDVEASAADSSYYKNKLNDLKANFISSTDDSSYVVLNSFDRNYATEEYTAGTLASGVDSLLAKGNVGSVVGPYVENGFYKLSKIVDKKPIVERVNGRHIFLKSGFQRAEKDSVLFIADSIRTMLNDGASFSSLASEWSADDSTSTKGGSLGWLSVNDEVNPDEKVKNALRTNLIGAEKGEFYMAEVPGGVSVYEATNFEYDGKKSVLAILSEKIVATEETKDALYEEVSSFALKYSSGEKFVEAAEEEGMSVPEQKVRSNSRTVPGIPNSGEIVRWAYSDKTSLDEVSTVFTAGEKYVVATLSKVQDENTPEFSTVEDAVREDALKQAKYEYAAAKMKSGSLEEIAKAVDGAESKKANLTFSTANLNGLGNNENEAVGFGFGGAQGAKSEPIKGDAGIVVVQVNERTLAAEKASYADDQTTLQNGMTSKYNRIKSSLSKTLVKDERNR